MPGIKAVNEIADKIRTSSSPDAIILFGSIASKGSGNDIDLLIVSSKKDEKKIREALRPFQEKFSIDTLTVTRRKLKALYYRGSPFLRLIQKEGKVVYMKNPLKEWRNGAVEDFKQAEYLFNGNFFKGSCYSAQQSIEKIIKWSLLKRGWELEKIHSIRRLLAIMKEYGLNLKIKDEDIDFIDSIYRGRYPAEEGLLPLGAPTRRDAKKALKIAGQVFEQLELKSWILKK
jgi:HEPN domain-containing protein